jgi:hypothetical protein
MKAWRNAATPTKTSLTNAHRISQQKEFFFSYDRSRNIIENNESHSEHPNKCMKTKELHDYRIII